MKKYLLNNRLKTEDKMDTEIQEVSHSDSNLKNILSEGNNSSIFEENIESDHELQRDWYELEGQYNEAIKSFNSISKININIDILKDPYKLFTLIFTEELLTDLANETNRYLKQYIESGNYVSERLKRWEDVTANELYTFIGVLLLLGINKRDSLYDHWSNNELLSSIVKKYIPMNKFKLLWRFLHLHNNNSNENKKESSSSSLHKIKSFITYLEFQWNKLYFPSQNLTIDGSIIPFRGGTNLKQYCPQKPKKYGIKAWGLAEANSGYMLRFSIY